MAIYLNFGDKNPIQSSDVSETNTPKLISVKATATEYIDIIAAVGELFRDLGDANVNAGADIYGLICYEVIAFYNNATGLINYTAIGYAQNLRDFPIITTTLLK